MKSERVSGACSRIAIAAALLCAVNAKADVLVPATSSSNTLPLIITGQYQQTYASGAFASLPAGHVIVGMAFAVDPISGSAFSGTISDLEVRVSTVSLQPSAVTGLLPLGSDSVLVHDGPISLTGSNNGVSATYDIIIPFSRPFSYVPANGTFLVDIVKRGSTPSYRYLEAGGNSLISRAWAFEGGVSSGFNVGYGVSTNFLTAVPEVPSYAMALLGVAMLLGLRSLQTASALSKK